MQILVLIAFMITQVTALVATTDPTWATLAGVLGMYLLGQVLIALASAGAGRFISRRPLQHRLALAGRIWLLGGLAGLGVAGLREAILSALPAENIPLAVDALMLLPFGLALVIYWLGEYPGYRRARLKTWPGPDAPVRCWTAREFIEYNLRHHVLIIALPVGLIVLLGDVGQLYLAPMLDDRPGGEWVLVAWSLASIGGVFLLAPLLIRRIWRTARLEPGPLRSELEALCSRMHVGVAEILIWRSGQVLANAAAMGLHRRLRYLLISDGLLAEMPPEAIRAIFAHEIAHIQQKHILYAGLFALAGALLGSAAGWGLASAAWAIAPLRAWLEPLGVGADEVELVATLAVLAGLWLWGFGYVSRRFERQCDVIGAWASGPGRPPDQDTCTAIAPAGVALFASALEQVTRLNGVPLHSRNWRHGRMADRIAYLHSLIHRGRGREEIDRRVRQIRRVLWAAVFLGAALAALRVAMEA